MRHITIGDIHGRDDWQAINIRNYDKIVFIGDYANSYEKSDFAILQMAYQRGNDIFTHAGITNSWYNEFLRLPILEDIREEGDNIAALINKVETTIQRHLLYATSIYRGGYSNGGFLWADYKETFVDMLNGYHQVVGHTQVQDIHSIVYSNKSVTYIDVLHNQIKFPELDITNLRLYATRFISSLC